MKYNNKVLISVGLFSIIFQLFNFKSLSDTLCLLSSIGFLPLIYFITKDDLSDKYNYIYNKFYILILLVYINNVIIYLNLPQVILISFKILILVILLLSVIQVLKYNNIRK